MEYRKLVIGVEIREDKHSDVCNEISIKMNHLLHEDKIKSVTYETFDLKEFKEV